MSIDPASSADVVRRKVRDGSSDVRAEGREGLGHHPRTFDPDYLAMYRRACSRVRLPGAVMGPFAPQNT